MYAASVVVYTEWWTHTDSRALTSVSFLCSRLYMQFPSLWVFCACLRSIQQTFYFWSADRWKGPNNIHLSLLLFPTDIALCVLNSHSSVCASVTVVTCSHCTRCCDVYLILAPCMKGIFIYSLHSILYLGSVTLSQTLLCVCSMWSMQLLQLHVQWLTVATSVVPCSFITPYIVMLKRPEWLACRLFILALSSHRDYPTWIIYGSH